MHSIGATGSSHATTAEREVALGALSVSQPILVATDGTPCADGAVALALDLAHKRGAALRLLSVVEPSPNMHATRGRREQIDVDRRERRLADVREQLARLSADVPLDDLDVDVIDGAAVGTIASAAMDAEASLVTLGLHSRGIIQRAFRDETALRVLRRVRCPLLAVTPTQRALPTDAVAAIDFGATSAVAARESAKLLADGGRLRLVHVAPDTRSADRVAAFEQLEALACELAADHRVDVECVVRRGSPHAELAAELRARPTEVVALGCRGCGASEAGPGRLTSEYVRAAAVSVLVGAPGQSAAR